MSSASRRRAGAIAAGLALLGTAPAPADLPPEAASVPASGAASIAGTEPFAILLARTPTPTGPDAWPAIPDADAWAQIQRGGDAGRQPGRWAMARSLIARSRGQEALGILQLMQADDAELAYVDAFRLALGAAQALSRHPSQAIASLESPGLAANPEACAWRLLSEDQIGAAVGGSARCAVDAIDARPQAERKPWLLALARNALAAGSASGADAALRGLPETDPDANLLRGNALMLLKDSDQARFFFRRAETDGTGSVRAAATLSLLQLRLAGKKPDPAARKELARLLRTWRGDGIEREALQTAYGIAVKDNDIPVALDTGQTLLDYHELGAEGVPLLGQLQSMMATLIAPDSGRPLDVAAGLFWDHRTLLPPGAEGDRLVQLLAGRLEQAGLYRRAAELLRHQMVARAQDVAMGALSIRVATLYLKAGQPETAIAAIRETARTPYPDPMVTEREQLRAVALAQLGRKDEALALLGAIPGSDALRNEILWHAEDWTALAAGTAAEAQRKLPLTPERTTLLLRRAIALAVLGREADLKVLRTAQAPLFASSPSGPVFLSLTAPGAVDQTRLAKAMQSLPSASPAGSLADLLPPTLRKASTGKPAPTAPAPSPAVPSQRA
jgi:hypothetical protein